jgi:hypothetical protein
MIAKIEPPHLPLRLYRYRSLKEGARALARELTAIKEGYLWGSPFPVLNDPMEGYYRPSSIIPKTDAEEINEAITGFKEKIGIICFSETYDNPLMWAHYAGNYGGICVEYTSFRIRRGLDDKSRLLRVAYVEELPRLGSSVAKDPEISARLVLSFKKMNWFYEREWRILGKIGKNEISKKEHPKLINKIYLGSKIEDSHRNRLVGEMRSLGVRTVMMEVEGYKHKFTELC